MSSSLFDIFIGLDDEVLGADMPADAHVDRVLAEQGRINLAYDPGLSGSYKVATAWDSGEPAGDRGFASVEWTCWMVRWVWVDPTVTGATVDVLGRIATGADPYDTAPAVEWKLELEGMGSARGTWAETTSARAEQLTAAVTVQRRARGAGFRQLRLWTRSNVTKEGPKVTEFLFRTPFPNELQIDNFYPLETGLPGPGAGTYHETGTRFDDGFVVDHLHQRQQTQMVVTPVGSLNPEHFHLCNLSYVVPYSAFVEIERTPEHLTARQVRANIIQSSDVQLAHAQAVESVYRRPRPLHAGFEGRFPEPGEPLEDYGFREHWSWSDAARVEHVIYSAPVRFTETDPTLLFRAQMLAAHCVDGFFAGDLAELANARTDMIWAIDLTVTQRRNTGGVVSVETLADIGTSFIASHLPVDGSGRYPVLTQSYWRNQGDLSAKDVTFREGQLFPNDFRLLGSTPPVEISTPLALDATQIQTPVFVEVSITSTTLLNEIVWGTPEGLGGRELVRLTLLSPWQQLFELHP